MVTVMRRHASVISLGVHWVKTHMQTQKTQAKEIKMFNYLGM